MFVLVTARVLRPRQCGGEFKCGHVVPTEYRYLSKKVVPTNQFSVMEYFLPMRPTDRAWPGSCLFRPSSKSQRGKTELPSFPNSSMCGSWRHICHDRNA